MTILGTTKKILEGVIKSNPMLDEWEVTIPETNITMRIVSAESEVGKTTLLKSEEGLVFDSFVFEGKEYLLLR